MALDLKRLDPEFPVEAMGLVGDDDLGRFLFSQCDAHGVARAALKALPGGATMSVDAFNVQANGRRTHFYHQGVAAEMTPDCFDFSSTRARILHLGLPGAHKAMDRPWRGEANGWVAVLRKARGSGLAANLELMTTGADRLAELGRPCLPHLDWLIVNDYEIGALAGRETRRADGSDRRRGGRPRDRRSARARIHAMGGGSLSRRRGRRRTRRIARRAGLARACRRAPSPAPTARATPSPPACSMRCMSNGRWKSVLSLRTRALGRRCGRCRRRRASQRSANAWRSRRNGAFVRSRYSGFRSR